MCVSLTVGGCQIAPTGMCRERTEGTGRVRGVRNRARHNFGSFEKSRAKYTMKLQREKKGVCQRERAVGQRGPRVGEFGPNYLSVSVR